MIIFYSRAFVNDNIDVARRRLMNQNKTIPKNEAVVIAFCLGFIVSLVCALIFMVCLVPNSDHTAGEWVLQAGGTIMVYLLFAVFVFIVFATGFVIQVLVNYQVNYPFIFELEQSTKLSHYMFYKLASFLATVWLIFFAAHLANFKLGT